MGGVKPFVFAYCDLDYCDKYAKALESSAKAHGHDCEVACSGERVTDETSKNRHCHYRYHLLPEMLEKHGPVLMLDVDSIVRKPIAISDNCELGLVLQENVKDHQRRVNGGCVYIVPALIPLALKMKERLKFQFWFDDQIVLNKYATKHKFRIFDDSFFSWKANPVAAIWTGKGKQKFSGCFKEELAKWR